MFQLLNILWLLSMFVIQDKHPIFHKHQNIINEATEIVLYKINTQPTASSQHNKDKQYVGDYEVMAIIDLKEEQKNELKKMVLDTKNYIGEKKSCPMQAQYAIKFQKKKHYIVLIVSEGACKKSLIVSSQKDINKHYHDLAEENSIHAFLEKI